MKVLIVLGVLVAAAHCFEFEVAAGKFIPAGNLESACGEVHELCEAGCASELLSQKQCRKTAGLSGKDVTGKRAHNSLWYCEQGVAANGFCMARCAEGQLDEGYCRKLEEGGAPAADEAATAPVVKDGYFAHLKKEGKNVDCSFIEQMVSEIGSPYLLHQDEEALAKWKEFSKTCSSEEFGTKLVEFLKTVQC